MKITVYMGLSLDGFIADENSSVDWLNDLPEHEDPEEDFGYYTLINSVDRLVMGRKTFDQVLGFGVWHYGDLLVTVLSHQPPPKKIPSEANISFAHGSPESLVKEFTSAGDKHIYLDGGDVVQQFLAAGYIDEFILTQVPVLLGKGLSLFKEPLPRKIWRVDRVSQYSNGFIQTHYIKKEPDS